MSATQTSHARRSDSSALAAPLRYLSVCSGIEAATVAWHPLGWEPVAFAEIEKHPSAVLAHHYPHVPNLGDMTKFGEWPDDLRPDVLVGGTPCQSFSVAGLRKGMADPRGNLALTYLAIADRYRPEWLLWENVPGVLSSNGGRDFGSFLGGMGELGYGFSYRVLDTQYVRVDGFERALPQRRRRVFVVGNSRDWRRAAAVLFERESLSWHSAPRRKTGKSVAPTISARPTGGGGLGTDFDLDGGLIAADIAPTLNAHFGEKQGLEDQHINGGAGLFVAHALRGEGFDASEDGTGRGTPVIPIDMRQASRGETMTNNRPDGSSGGAPGTGIGNAGDPAPTIASSHIPAIAFSCKDHGADAGPVAPTLRSMGHDGSHANAGGQVAIAIQERAVSENLENGPQGKGYQESLAYTLEARNKVQSVATDWAVRRLTPRECERLQGFPDDYTNVPWRGKDQSPDGPRYKDCGNSMSINAMRWLGRRMAVVDQMSAQPTTAISSKDGTGGAA